VKAAPAPPQLELEQARSACVAAADAFDVPANKAKVRKDPSRCVWIP